MTRIVDYTIPSAFIRLDHQVSAADSYVDVHTQQTARKNHNKLLACRIRQPLFSLHATANTAGAAAVGPDPLIYDSNAVSPERDNSSVIMAAPIFIPHRCKSCTFVVEAGVRSTAEGNVELYPVIDPPNGRAEIDTGVVITLTTATTRTRYAVTVPVPAASARYGIGTFVVYGVGSIYAADLKAATAITDVGRDWVEAAFTSAFTNAVVYITTDTDIEPRMIRGAMDLGATERLYLDSPWNKVPIPGTDTAAIRAINGLRLWEACLYPDRIAGFSDADTAL